MDEAEANGGEPHGAANGTHGRLARRIKFRLDDGSLIADSSLVGLGSAGVVRVPLDKAVDRHLAGERELERLQRLLSLPDLPEVTSTELGPPAKKPRLESKPSVSLGPVSDWVPKCKDIVKRVRIHLGPEGHWFENAVDGNVVKDYYGIIKQPMWMTKVDQKLDTGEYTGPNEFAEDVRRIWANCFLYNGKGTLVRVQGEKGERKFEELWSNSGLSSERSKRATAGVAAPKFEPELEPPKPGNTFSKPAASRGHANNNKKAPTPSSARANGGRAYSHEVTSGGKAREKALSSDRRTQIANDLQAALSDGSLSEELVGELMELLPQEAMQQDAEGETELDFEVLDDASLRKLDAWLRNVKGQGPPSPSHMSMNPSVRLENDQPDDDEYVSE